MGDARLFVNLGLAFLAALVGGLIASRLRLPLLVGYLLAGVAVGPHTPGFIVDEETVHAVSQLGVVLLMFAVGVQLHLKELATARRLALMGGGLQLAGTIILGLLVGIAFGWGLYGGLFLGCALALSSTAVMMRVLEERGELGTAHGTAMLAVLVTQDLSVVVMVTLLPSLAVITSEGPQALAGVGWSLLLAAASLFLTLLLALRVAPALLERIVRTGSRELFVLAMVCICLGAAYLAQLAGLSLEIGAFLAGVVISESDYAHEAFSQVRPLRDVFASLFFVSVGMLLNPAFLVHNWGVVLAVVLTIIVGKGLVSTLAVYAAGCHGRTSLLTGLGLAQIGEFSFVLAGIGSERGLIPPRLGEVILAAALITILTAPFVFSAAGSLYTRLNRVPLLSLVMNRYVGGEALLSSDGAGDTRVLILGGGRVGRYISDALRTRGVPHVVVDYDAVAVERLNRLGVPLIYGDATSDVVLAQACWGPVELAVVALPDANMTEIAVQRLKHLAPDLRILVRVHRGDDIPRLWKAGAEMVFHAEFETATAMIRETLAHFETREEQIGEYVDHIRQVRYRREEA